jgi:hypothetical protein
MERRNKDRSAAETALLAQYSPSQSMRARFLDAAHCPGKSMPRDYPTGDAVHTLHAQESELDCLNYFTTMENRSDMRAEFRTELTKTKRFHYFPLLTIGPSIHLLKSRGDCRSQ